VADILLKELAILVKEEIEERLCFVSISRISVLKLELFHGFTMGIIIDKNNHER
jgi:hypothetical protein